MVLVLPLKEAVCLIARNIKNLCVSAYRRVLDNGQHTPCSFFPPAVCVHVFKHVFYSLLSEELEKQQVGGVIVLPE